MSLADTVPESAPAKRTTDPLWVTRRPIRAGRRLVTTRSRPSNLPPGPIGLPVVGVLPQLWRDPFSYLDSCAKQYGDIYRVPLPLYDVVMLNHPDHVPGVFDTRGDKWISFSHLASIGAPLSGGLWTGFMDGPPHQARRRLLNPVFGRRNLAKLADTIAGEFATQLDKWETYADSGEEFDLQNAIAQVTLPTFLRTMYSVDLSDKELHDIHEGAIILGTQFAANVLLCPPPNPIKAAHYARKLQRLLAGFVAERESNPTDDVDLLAFLMQAHEQDPQGLPRGDMYGEMLGLAAGGYDTTVAAMAWAVSLLGANPDPLQRLYDEIDTLGGRRPGFDDLSRLPWTRACFDEAQRLQGHPFIPHFARVDTEIDGYSIPKGTCVGVSPYSIQRDPRWWNDPERFDPTRFTDEEVVKARPRTAFIPFGHGPHHCMGSAMAYMNGQFLLTMIYQRYRLHFRPGWQPRHKTTWTTIVKGGVPVTITRAPRRKVEQ